MAIDEKRLAEIRREVDGFDGRAPRAVRDLLAMLDEQTRRVGTMRRGLKNVLALSHRIARADPENATHLRRFCESAGVVPEVLRLASPASHAHPRDERAVLAHEARGAVGDEEREAQGGPRGDDVG